MMITDGDLAITAAQAGAAVVRAKYGASLTRFEKSAGDFATDADIEAEKTILDVLRSARPADPVTGEESGRTGASVAERMWLVDPLCGSQGLDAYNREQIFRHLHPAMRDMEVPQVSAWAEANRPRVYDMLSLIDSELAGREYMAGDRYTIADITALVASDFMKPAKLARPPGLVNFARWYDAVSARPSAAA